MESFGASYATIGLFFTAYSLTWTVLQLYSGYLADRYGRRRLLLIGLFIYGLAALGCALAHNFAQLLIGRLVQGVGLGIFGPAMLGEIAGFERKERAFAVYHSAQSLPTLWSSSSPRYPSAFSPSG